MHGLPRKTYPNKDTPFTGVLGSEQSMKKPVDFSIMPRFAISPFVETDVATTSGDNELNIALLYLSTFN